MISCAGYRNGSQFRGGCARKPCRIAVQERTAGEIPRIADKTLGIAIMLLDIAYTMQGMLKIYEAGELKISGIMLVIVSLVVRTLLGELVRLEKRLE